MVAQDAQLLTTASSDDGRRFSLGPEAPVSHRVGALLRIADGPGGELLGQLVGADAGRSEGLVLGRIVDGRLDRSAATEPFADSSCRPAAPGDPAALQAAAEADLEVGGWRTGSLAAMLRLRAKGFNRHSFLCGQSGSGKTYALGVLLERLLLETRLPMVIIDPNADFVHLGEVRDDAPDDVRRALGDVDLGVLRRGTGPDALKVTFVDLPVAAQAAVLSLDPVLDRSPYHRWLRLRDEGLPVDQMRTTVAQLLAGTDEEQALAQRIVNLRLIEWDVWAYGSHPAPLLPPVGGGARVLDVSGFEYPTEPLVVALAVVEQLWARRNDRSPTLLVIDEAHNICPADPVTPLQRAVTDRLVQIAAEGRKYGLWLMLSTQRPSKVHPQVLSQCDNLITMRMNSPADVEELIRLFGFAPADMIRSAPSFRQGELLVAGPVAPVPSIGVVGARWTREGGSDVSVPMR